MKPTFLKTSTRRSPLSEIQNLNGKARKKTAFAKELALALPLTSLIDAFSIIVIYLLIGTQNSGFENQIPHKMNLPMADHSQTVEKMLPILKIEKGQYFLNDRPVAQRDLGNQLAELKKQADAATGAELLIQADQEMNYEDLDPLLRASSEAGIAKMKFAVVPTR